MACFTSVCYGWGNSLPSCPHGLAATSRRRRDTAHHLPDHSRAGRTDSSAPLPGPTSTRRVPSARRCRATVAATGRCFAVLGDEHGLEALFKRLRCGRSPLVQYHACAACDRFPGLELAGQWSAELSVSISPDDGWSPALFGRQSVHTEPHHNGLTPRRRGRAHASAPL